MAAPSGGINAMGGNQIPVKQDGATGSSSAPAAISLGGGGNSHPSISDHSPVSTKVEHSICNDAADQSGTVVMIGVGGGFSLPFLFFHAPRSGEETSPSQPHKF
jgi:hypothetical protein